MNIFHWNKWHNSELLVNNNKKIENSIDYAKFSETLLLWTVQHFYFYSVSNSCHLQEWQRKKACKKRQKIYFLNNLSKFILNVLCARREKYSPFSSDTQLRTEESDIYTCTVSQIAWLQIFLAFLTLVWELLDIRIINNASFSKKVFSHKC